MKVTTLGMGVWVWLAHLTPVMADTQNEVAVHNTKNEKKASNPNAKKRKGFPAPYRESILVYRNVVSARSFDKNADLTYNPYYAMEFDLAPTFWAGPHTYLTLDVAFSKELTEPDGIHSRETTKQREVVLSDIYLEAGVPHLVKIPVVNIDVWPSIRFYVPSSKVSRARTLILGLRPGFSLIKRFKVFRGLSLSYRFWMHKGFHESTTAVTETPLVDDPIGSTRSTESLMNTGLRNANFGLSNGLGLKLAILKWLGINVQVAIVHQFLYELTYEDERISFETQTPTDVRYIVAYTGEIYARPFRPLTIALGFLTENFQLTRSSTYEKPFFNRYTAIFLDLRLYLAGLASQIQSKRGSK